MQLEHVKCHEESQDALSRRISHFPPQPTRMTSGSPDLFDLLVLGEILGSIRPVSCSCNTTLYAASFYLATPRIMLSRTRVLL